MSTCNISEITNPGTTLNAGSIRSATRLGGLQGLAARTGGSLRSLAGPFKKTTRLLVVLVPLARLLTQAGSAPGQTWTPQAGFGPFCAAVASSADGTKFLAAADRNGTWSSDAPPTIGPGPIFASTNAGATWTQTSVPSYTWAASAVASSADGTKLVAVANMDDSGNPGRIYTSTDSGATWRATSAPLNYWGAAASSADGTKLVAAAAGWIARNKFLLTGTGSGTIFASTDSGATWTQTSAPTNNWAAVASSADGTKLVAAGGGWSPGLIYTSANSGATWRVTSAPSNLWSSVASSADGTKLVAAGYRLINTSTNSGATWAATSLPLSSPNSVTVSADGTEVAVAGQNGAVCISVDSGVTWTTTVVPGGGWVGSLAMSADGSRLLAADINGGIYTLQPVFLHIQLSGNQAQLAWSRGTLQWASQASGPYQEVTNAISPYKVATSAPQRFYRVKAQ